MARLPRLCPSGMPVHVMHRGNNRKICFVCKEDYLTYLGLLNEGATAYGVKIHSWVLMTNHIHFLATPESDFGISRLMQYVGSYYVRYFNQLYRRTGTLWEGRFKSCLVDSDSYFLLCHRYIELNPVRAKMAVDPGEYPWSSYSSNALGRKSKLTTPHNIYMSLASTPEGRLTAYRELFNEVLEQEALDDLRCATQSGLAFGSEYFKDQIETLYGQRVRPEKPGRKTEH